MVGSSRKDSPWRRMSYPVTIEIDVRIVTGAYTIVESGITILSGGAVKTSQRRGGAGDAERRPGFDRRARA
jgi:hypothetical protein